MSNRQYLQILKLLLELEVVKAPWGDALIYPTESLNTTKTWYFLLQPGAHYHEFIQVWIDDE